jgi:alpha-beta hydrolase superfamily lysophospholipase
MSFQEGVFSGVDGIQLYYQFWPAQGAPKANIIIVHGFGENCNRWKNLLSTYPQLGYNIFVYDQRGHGRSPGQRGYINSFSEFRGDLLNFVQLVTAQSPDLPRFLYGMSMGGLITLYFGLHHPEVLSGAICTAPAVGKLGLPPALFALAKILDRIWPRFTMENPIAGNLLSRDKEWVQSVLADPLSSGKGTPRLVIEMGKAADWVHAHAAEWRIPLLLLHGSADGFASVDGSRQFAAEVNSPLVKYTEYEGGYHELHNDVIKDQVMRDVQAWLADHLA